MDHGIIAKPSIFWPPCKRLNLTGCHLQFRITFHQLARCPDFGWRPTPVTVDQAYWSPKFLTQLLSKKVTHGTETHHFLRSANLPAALTTVLWEACRCFGDMEKPNIGVIGIRSFVLALLKTMVTAPFHVALSTANPYFAD